MKLAPPPRLRQIKIFKYPTVAQENTPGNTSSHMGKLENSRYGRIRSKTASTGADSFLPPFPAGYQRQDFAQAHFVKALAAQTRTV